MTLMNTRAVISTAAKTDYRLRVEETVLTDSRKSDEKQTFAAEKLLFWSKRPITKV
jgi:hypothetical protein